MSPDFKNKMYNKNPTNSNANELKRQSDIQLSQFCQYGKRSFFALGISIKFYFLCQSGTRKQRKIEHWSKNSIINEYRIHEHNGFQTNIKAQNLLTHNATHSSHY